MAKDDNVENPSAKASARADVVIEIPGLKISAASQKAVREAIWNYEAAEELYRRQKLGPLWRGFVDAVEATVALGRTAGSDIAAKPPALAELVLHIFTPRDIKDATPGDLVELYQTEKLPELGPRRAHIWFWGQVARSVVPLFLMSIAKATIWVPVASLSSS